MRSPETIFHNGHKIIYLDYSNLKDKAEITHLLDTGAELIRKQELNTVLSLVNIENMFFNNEIRSNFIQTVKGNNPYVKKSTIYGLKGLISILFNSFIVVTGRNLKSFKSRQDAIEYLVS